MARNINLAVALFAASLLMAVPVAAAAAQPSAFPNIVSPAGFEGLAAVMVLAVISASAMAYGLGNIINRASVKEWSKSQIYEALLSLALLVLFAGFLHLFLINPIHAFSTLRLVPNSCSSSSAAPPTNIFELSACDLSSFNNNAFNAYGGLFWLTFLSSSVPGVEIKISPFGISPSASGGVPISGSDFGGITLSTETDLVPTSADQFFSFAFSILLFAIALNQVQMILLSSSMLFLYLFITIGLVARIFGFSRGFGGVMIALGLGLGFVYPLLVSITYGFINVQLQSFGAGLPFFAQGINSFSMAVYFIKLLLGFVESLFTSTLSINPNVMGMVGDLIIGLTLIPIMNFVILDTFIMDFSASIGERLNFMSLLTGFI
ncbi:MAG: hypothetical protein M1448_01750 [Candidatus Marsarchaeota archaeon]|jgi:hypothetical protein|nr:hypothetical protein [Candidatus Marsarchaeota archaeon]